jgi:uncharacterized protein (DUF1330 family)
MPAYFIYLCQEVTDRRELEIYWEKIGPTLVGYDAKNVVGYTPFELLEGDHVEGVAVVEFPSIEVAKAWYDSPAYREIRSHRQRGAKYIGLLARGGALPANERMPQTR